MTRCTRCNEPVMEVRLVNCAGVTVDILELDATPDPEGPYRIRFFKRRLRRFAVRREEWPGSGSRRAHHWHEHSCAWFTPAELEAAGAWADETLRGLNYQPSRSSSPAV